MPVLLSAVITRINALLDSDIQVDNTDLPPESEDPLLYQVLRVSQGATRFEAALRLLLPLPRSIKRKILRQRERYYPYQSDHETSSTYDEFEADYEEQACHKGIIKVCLETYVCCMPALMRFIAHVFLLDCYGQQQEKTIDRMQRIGDLKRLFYLDYHETGQVYDLFLYDLSGISYRWRLLLPAVLMQTKRFAALLPMLIASPKLKHPYFFKHYTMTPFHFACFLHFYLDCIKDQLITWDALSRLLLATCTQSQLQSWEHRDHPVLHHMIGQSRYRGSLSHVLLALQRLQRTPTGKKLCMALFQQRDYQGDNPFAFGIKCELSMPALRALAKAYLMWGGRMHQPVLCLLSSPGKPFRLIRLADNMVEASRFDLYLNNLRAFLSPRDARMVFNWYFLDGTSVFSQIAHYSPSILSQFLVHYFYLYRRQPAALNARLCATLNPVPLLHLFLLSLCDKSGKVAVKRAKALLCWARQLSPTTQAALWHRAFLQWRVLEMAALLPRVFPLFLEEAWLLWGADKQKDQGQCIRRMLGLENNAVSDRPIIVMLLIHSNQLGALDAALRALLLLPPHIVRALWEQKFCFSHIKLRYAWDKRAMNFKWKQQYRMHQSVTGLAVTALEVAVVSPVTLACTYQWVERARQYYNKGIQCTEDSWTRHHLLSSTTRPIGACLIDYVHREDSVNGGRQLKRYVGALLRFQISQSAILSLLSIQWKLPFIETYTVHSEPRIFMQDITFNALLAVSIRPDAFYVLLSFLKKMYVDMPYALFCDKRAQRRALSHSPQHILCRKRSLPPGVFKRRLSVLKRRWTREMRQYQSLYQRGKQKMVQLLQADKSRLFYPVLHRLIFGLRCHPSTKGGVCASLRLLRQLDTPVCLSLLLQKNIQGEGVIQHVVYHMPRRLDCMMGILGPVIRSMPTPHRDRLWVTLLGLSSECVFLPIIHILTDKLSLPALRACLKTLYRLLPHRLCTLLLDQKMQLHGYTRGMSIYQFIRAAFKAPQVSSVHQAALLDKAACIVEIHTMLSMVRAREHDGAQESVAPSISMQH